MVITPGESNNCRISTIVEDMAWLFDNAVNPKHISKLTRMRLALAYQGGPPALPGWQ